MSREMIANRGYILSTIELPAEILQSVKLRDWTRLDQAIGLQTQPKGMIFEALRNYAEFSQIEFIISIRSSLIEPDEDGIWHDDGSRVLAFSLSLTLDHDALQGGRLEIRNRKNPSLQTTQVLPTPPYGTMIVFATGHQDFEHKINCVSQGERIIIAGWCTSV